jgi:hypothetical protein
VKNPKELTIRGSLWALAHPSKGDSESCILYLHPNSGCRADVIKTRIMTIAAHSKCAVCGFDFIGCGESDGDNVCSSFTDPTPLTLCVRTCRSVSVSMRRMMLPQSCHTSLSSAIKKSSSGGGVWGPPQPSFSMAHIVSLFKGQLLVSSSTHPSPPCKDWQMNTPPLVLVYHPCL